MGRSGWLSSAESLLSRPRCRRQREPAAWITSLERLTSKLRIFVVNERKLVCLAVQKEKKMTQLQSEGQTFSEKGKI